MKTLKRKTIDISTLVKKAENLYVPLDFKENHAYFANPDGTRAYHGVTSILRVINKPALIGWAVSMMDEHIRANIAYVIPGEDGGYWAIKPQVIEEAKKAHQKKKEDAGVKGSDVHAQIEAIVKNAIEKCGGYICEADRVNPNDQVQLFVMWAIDNKVKFIESEKVVYSKESWYAGTCDLVLEMDGKKYIADVKTSSGIYPEAYLQMAAYQGALEEMNEHTDIAGAMVINLPKKGGFEIGMNYAYDDNRMAFLAALVLYKQLNSLK